MELILLERRPVSSWKRHPLLYQFWRFQRPEKKKGTYYLLSVALCIRMWLFVHAFCCLKPRVLSAHKACTELKSNKESINKFIAKTSSHICGEEFTNNNNKIYNHYHVTGKYRGAAHDNCNLHLSMPRFIKIFIHNLKYISKIFIEWIVNLCKNENDLRIIPDTNKN